MTMYFWYILFYFILFAHSFLYIFGFHFTRFFFISVSLDANKKVRIETLLNTFKLKLWIREREKGSNFIRNLKMLFKYSPTLIWIIQFDIVRVAPTCVAFHEIHYFCSLCVKSIPKWWKYCTAAFKHPLNEAENPITQNIYLDMSS